METFSALLAFVRRIPLTKTSDAELLLSGVPDYFGRNEISSGGDLSDYSSASLY